MMGFWREKAVANLDAVRAYLAVARSLEHAIPEEILKVRLWIWMT